MAQKKKQVTEVKPADSKKELRSQVKKLRDELFQLQLDHEQRKLKNTSLLKVKRKEIARFLTTLRVMELTQ